MLIFRSSDHNTYVGGDEENPLVISIADWQKANSAELKVLLMDKDVSDPPLSLSTFRLRHP